MDKIRDRISYIEGLAEGLDLYENKREGKFYHEVIGILTDMNQTIVHIDSRLSELEEYVEAIDEDLNDIEWDYYEDGPEDFDEIYEMEDNDQVENTADEIEVTDFYQVICPNCQETVLVNHEALDDNYVDEVLCPNCQEVLIIDTEDLHNGQEAYQ